EDPGPGDGPVARLTVRLGPRADLNEERALGALALHPELFTRAGRIVRIVDDAALRVLDADALIPVLSACADFEKVEKSGQGASCQTRAQLARSLAARGVYPELRRVDGVTGAPILHPDGQVTATPGYDERTRLVYVPSGPVPPIEPDPTREGARAAVA